MTDREIDTLVAGRIMGWKTFAGEPPGYGRPPGKVSLVLDEVPHYSTSREAANQVFHRMNDHPEWEVWERFNTLLNDHLPDSPRQLCIAALRAVGVEIPE